MKSANPSTYRPSAITQRPGQGLVSAFALGLPLAIFLLWLVSSVDIGGMQIAGPLSHTPAHRYVHHPVECVEVVMFSCALGALFGKLRQNLRERAALRVKVVQPWDGEVVPVGQASVLLHEARNLPGRLQGTYLVRRVRSVLEFLHGRGSADELDDQLRSLSDQDAIALDGSNSLVRFITWAIPILGFLGTVLGITGAISGVTPEVLEKSLSTVTDGLALAFDATALALALTMITMFCNFIVDRMEQGVLESVDHYVDRELAHRFERSLAGNLTGSIHNDSQLLSQLCDQLVRRQAEVWGKALLEIDKRRAEADRPNHKAIVEAMSTALESTIESHAQRMAAVEKTSLEQASHLSEQLAALGDKLTHQAEVLTGLQEGEQQLVRVQETLNRNLEAVSAAGVLQDAVHSLIAAVHLLTARGNSAPAGGPRKAA